MLPFFSFQNLTAEDSVLLEPTQSKATVAPGAKGTGTIINKHKAGEIKTDGKKKDGGTFSAFWMVVVAMQASLISRVDITIEVPLEQGYWLRELRKIMLGI